MLEVNSYITGPKQDTMFTKRYGKQLVAMFYVWRGITIINEDKFVMSVLN